MKACIFDLDGTLADTLESLSFSVCKTLEKMKLPPITENQCRAFVGDGAQVLLERSIEAAGENKEKRLKEAIDIYKVYFDRYCTYHVKVYPGIKELLQRLKKDGYKLGVLSNKPHPQAVKVVNTIFEEGLFDIVWGQKRNINRKPDPEGLERMLKKLRATKEESVYVGDSEVDVQTGENADIRTIVVAWGFRTKESLVAAGAQEIICLPAELYKSIYR